MENKKQIQDYIDDVARRMFVRGLAVGLILVLALVILAGALPYVHQGIDALFISENGKVGIGTNNPGAELDVNGTVKANKFEGDGSSLMIDSEGRLKEELDKKFDKAGGNITSSLTIIDKVGIGTMNPEVPLDVTGSAKIRGGIEPDYDSGWFFVKNNQNEKDNPNLIKNHNLGTLPRQVQMFFSENQNGSPAYIAPVVNANNWDGYNVELTDMKVIIRTGTGKAVCQFGKGKALAGQGYYRLLLWK